MIDTQYTASFMARRVSMFLGLMRNWALCDWCLVGFGRPL